MPRDREQEERERIANAYRFGGYQLPMIQLDESGPSYILISPTLDSLQPLSGTWVSRALSYGPSGPNMGNALNSAPFHRPG